MYFYYSGFCYHLAITFYCCGSLFLHPLQYLHYVWSFLLQEHPNLRYWVLMKTPVQFWVELTCVFFFHFMTFFYLCEQEIFSFIRVCYYNIMHLSPHDFYIEIYIQSLIFLSLLSSEFFIFIFFRNRNGLLRNGKQSEDVSGWGAEETPVLQKPSWPYETVTQSPLLPHVHISYYIVGFSCSVMQN